MACVVVPGRHALDVVAPVLALAGALGREHHARGHRALAGGMADIEALDALGRPGQIQHPREHLHALQRQFGAQRPHAQRIARVLERELQPLALEAALRHAQFRGAAGGALQRLRQRFVIGQRDVDQDLRRRRLAAVVEQQKVRQGVCRLAQGAGREMTRGAEILALAHRQHADRILAGLADDGDHVGIGTALRIGDLLRADFLQLAQLIAQSRGVLELQLSGRGLHAPLQLTDHLGVAAFEHTDRALQIARIVLATDQAHARRRAASDLVLQARPAAVGEERVAAVSDLEHLLQVLQHFLDRMGARKRTEQAAVGLRRGPR